MFNTLSRRAHTSLPISLLMLLVLFSSLVLVPESRGEEMTPIPMISGIEMLKVGDTAPDFTIQDIEGNEFSMKGALGEGNGVLIFFWSIFCEPCKQELPIIQELTDAYLEKGIKVVGVVLDGTPMKEAISAFIGQENYSFRVLIDELNPDESFKVSDPYGVAGTPTLYVINSNSEVLFSKVGRASKEEVEAAIKQVL